MRRNLTLSFVCVAVLACAVFALAADKATTDSWAQPVSLDLKDASLGNAVEALLRGANVNYSIDPRVLGICIPSLSITGVPRRDALKSLLMSTGAVERTENGVTMISPGQEWLKNVSVDFNGTPMRDALDLLFAKAGVIGWKVDKDVPSPKVTYTASEVPFITALGVVLKPAAAVFGWQHVVAGDAWQRVIDMELKDVPLPEAIDALFKDTGISYTLDPAVQQLRVTAMLKNIPLDQALRGVLKAAGAVYRVENSIYVIGPRPSGSAEPVGEPGKAPAMVFGPPGASLTAGTSNPPGGNMPRPQGALPGLASPSGDGIVTRVIDLKYVSAGDVAPMFASRGVSVSATSGNKLIITGSVQAMGEAAALISAIDDESALARTIRLKMTAKITVSTAKGPKTYEASTESVGAEQTASLLNLETQTPYHTDYSTVTKQNQVVKQSQLNFSRIKLVDATIVPTMGQDGRVGLAGRGHFAFPFGTTPGTELSKDFDIGASAASGKPVVVAAGSATLDIGKAEFSVSITATPEQGRVHFAPPSDEPAIGAPGMPRPPGGYGGQTDYGRSYGGGGGYGGGGSGARSW